MVVSEFFLRSIISQVLSDPDLDLTSNTLLETDGNGNPSVPPDVLAQWSTVRDAILDQTDSQTLNKILTCANVPKDFGGTHSLRDITEDLFDESFRANNDAITVLSGNPASNLHRFYLCNNFRDTLRLNRGAKRFSATADPAKVEEHETTGAPFYPLVTLHNWPDHRVPFRHEVQYGLKAFETGSSDLFTPIPVVRYGHCNVEPAEAVAALGLLVLQATGWELYEPERVLPDAGSRTRFREFIEQFNIRP